MSATFSTQPSPLPPMEFSEEGEAMWQAAQVQADGHPFSYDILLLAERWARMMQGDLLPSEGLLARCMLTIRSILGYPPAPRDFSSVDVWKILKRADEKDVYTFPHQFEGVVRLLGKCWVYGPELLRRCADTNFRSPY